MCWLKAATEMSATSPESCETRNGPELCLVKCSGGVVKLGSLHCVVDDKLLRCLLLRRWVGDDR